MLEVANDQARAMPCGLTRHAAASRAKKLLTQLQLATIRDVALPQAPRHSSYKGQTAQSLRPRP